MEKNQVNDYAYPTGQRSYPVRELKKDKDTGLTYIGFVHDSKGKNIMDNWYEKIQKPADSCNVRILLERAVVSDNTAILNQRQKVSADLSGLPDNLLDVMNQFQGVKNYFDQLPVDIKKDFGNNVYEFVKRQGKLSDSAREYIQSLNKSKLVEPIVDPKKDDKKGDD